MNKPTTIVTKSKATPASFHTKVSAFAGGPQSVDTDNAMRSKQASTEKNMQSSMRAAGKGRGIGYVK